MGTFPVDAILSQTRPPARPPSVAPVVSCIVPVFNGERYLAEALHSILNQSYPRIEVIVVDDGSRDRTAAVASTLGDRIRYVRQGNLGPGEARNTGMSLALGEFIAFLDADDLWRPDKLSTQLEYLQANPAIDLCFTLRKNFWMPELNGEEARLKEQQLFRLAHPFTASTLVGRRRAFERAGRWNAKLRGEDSDYFSRMQELGIGFHVINRVLVDRRIHGRNLSSELEIVRRESLLLRAKQHLQKRRQSVQGAAEGRSGIFAEASRRFREAVGPSGSVDRDFLLAGNRIRLRFANPTLLPYILPALEHLGTGTSGHPKLTIHLWDVASTGVGMPRLDAGGELGLGGPGELWSRKNARSNQHAFHSDYHRSLNLLDGDSGEAFYCNETTDDFPLSESGSPLARIFSWWAKDSLLQLVHAAAIGTPDGAVLLAGRGGSGKSTVALASLAGDLLYLSDDYCLVKSLPSCVYSLFSSGKHFAAEAGRYPHLNACPGREENRGGRSKRVVYLAQEFRDRIPPSLPLRAVLVPVQHPGPESRLEPTTRMAALRALAPSTLFQLNGASSDDFTHLADLISNLPCHTLHLGKDPNHAVKVIGDFLRRQRPSLA